MRRTLLLASLCAPILFVLVTVAVATNSAVQGSVGPAGIVALLFFVGVVLWAALATNEVIPKDVRELDQWLKPKVLAAFASALVVAAGALFSLLPLLHSPNSQADERTSASIEQLRQDIETSGRSSGGATSNRFSLVSSAPVFNGLGSSYRLKLLDNLGSDTELNCRISILDENIAPYLNAVAKSCEDMSISLGLAPLPASLKSGTKYEYSLDT